MKSLAGLALALSACGPSSAGEDGARAEGFLSIASGAQASRPTTEELEARIFELTRELQQERAKRLEREEAWLAYARTFAELAPHGAAAPDEFAIELPVTFIGPPRSELPTPAPGPSAEEQAQNEASAAVARSLRNLLYLEEVRGLELVELGRLAERGAGPVAFRLLDVDGRPAGGLVAERLHLEGSRAAKTVTLVLSDGCETRAGARIPFSGGAPDTGIGGVRRIELPHADPERWIEAVPELFTAQAELAALDDGRFDLRALRAALNQRLAADAQLGYYELEDVAGVLEGVFQRVRLAELDRDGQRRRFFFADRLRVRAEGDSIVLELEDGVQVRGAEKTPYLEGRFRIYLPRAKAGEWRADGIPVLGANPSAIDVR